MSTDRDIIDTVRDILGLIPSRERHADAAALIKDLIARVAPAWQPMATAPEDRPILLFGEVDGGDFGAAATVVMAQWVSPDDDVGFAFGDEGGWLVSFTDGSICSVERPTCWTEIPRPGDRTPAAAPAPSPEPTSLTEPRP